MNSSLSSKDDTVTKCPYFVRTKLRQSNIPLPIVDDKYSFTRARNALVSLITSIESLEPPSYWYNISDNSIGSLYELFRLEECVFLSIMRTCGLIRQKFISGKSSYIIEQVKWNAFLSQYELCDVEISTSKFSIVVDNNMSRRNMTFIRIGTKSSSSYLKATLQCNHKVLPPLIKMRQLTHQFLNSISTGVLDTIDWTENECFSVPAICKNVPFNSTNSTSSSRTTSTSTSTSTSHDNPLIVPSLYPTLDKLNINTSDLDSNPVDVIYLKNLLSEVCSVLKDNNIDMDLEKWGGRGNKKLIQIPPVGHLKYDRFK